jgi:hypothetical protein
MSFFHSGLCEVEAFFKKRQLLRPFFEEIIIFIAIAITLF